MTLTHLPLAEPLVVTSPFGVLRSNGKYHKGVDLRAPVGSPTFAVSAATVARTGEDATSGRWIVLDLADGREAVYVHLDTIDVVKGQVVQGGEQIGTTGATGKVTGPHLHLEIQTPGKVNSETDPMVELSRTMVKTSGGPVLLVSLALARAAGWL